MSTVAINGVELAFEVAGDGPPVLMIAGCGQPASSWEFFGAPLLRERGYQVITFDNRGVPPSEAPEGPYSIGQMAEDAAALLLHLGLANVRVIGASMGSWIAVELAASHPDLVAAAVMLVGLGRESAYSLTEMRAVTALARAGVEWPSDLSALDAVRTMLPPSAWHDDEQVNAITSIASVAFPSWGNPGRLGQYEACLAWLEGDHDARLRAIAAPCLVMAAEHDANATPDHVRAQAELIPDARFQVIADQNHIPLGAVDAIIGQALTFFDDVGAGRAN